MAAPSADLIKVVAKANPFRDATTEHYFPAGEITVAEIVERVQPDEALRLCVNVFIGDINIPQTAWRYTRPKAGALVNVIVVPQNAQQGAAAGSIGLTLAGTILIATGVGAPIGIGLIVAGTALGLAAQYFLAPSVDDPQQDQDSDVYNLRNTRNRVDPWGPVSCLLGKFRFAPKISAREYAELVGSDRYLRVIFQLSDGPVTDPLVFIGDTSLAEFDDVETEFRRGYPSLTDKGNWDASSGAFPTNPVFADTYTVSVPGTVDGQSYTTGETITFNGLYDRTQYEAWDRDQGKPFTLYTNDVNQESIGATVTRAGGPVVRTTQANADEIAINILFAGGLYFTHNSPPGKKGSLDVTLGIDYAPTGTTEWRPAGTSGNYRITGRTSKPLFWGERWKTDGSDPSGQYDVRITRQAGDHDGTKAVSEFTWATLDTITERDVVPILGYAQYAMRFRATAQINGSLDQVFFECQSIVRHWDGASWTWRPSSNPAAHIRHMLQHHNWPRRRFDSQIDLAGLEEFSETCTANGWECNAYLDSDQSLWDRLRTIAACGEASMAAPDGKWGVIADEPRPYPRQMFTPTNTWGYSSELLNADLPHAMRVRFWSDEISYNADELIVFADGYDDDTATNYERLTLVGTTSKAQAYEQARRWLARKNSQREVHRFNADLEHIVVERGDRALLGHTVISVTLATGRIAALITEDGVVTAVRLTTKVEMEAGNDYALVVRTLGDIRTFAVETVAGWTDTLTLDPAIESGLAPSVDDLFSFGISGIETLDVLIASKEPGENYSARIEAIPYVPGVYTAADVLPVFDARVSNLKILQPPVVEDIISDATVMQVTQDRGLIPQAVIRVKPAVAADAVLHVWYRESETSHSWSKATNAASSPTSVVITGLNEAEQYDFRLMHTHPDYLTSKPTQVFGHEIVGRTAPPANITGLTLGMVGGQAELRWTLPPDLDVQYGGAIIFRHSPATSGATWETSTSIGRGSVAGSQTHVVLPLKAGTYLAKAFDSTGRFSENAASITTKQGSMFSFSQVGVALESPTFSGTKTNCTVVSNTLRLLSGDIDSAADWDAIADFDAEGAVVRESGTYEFNTTIDLGSVQNVRITSEIEVVIFDAFDLIDLRLRPIDEWEDIDSSVGAPADAYVEYSVTDDDPAGSPTWGPWLRLDSVEDSCRGIRGRAILYTDDRTYNVGISTLQIKAETVDAIT